jgi:hypothetical protein
MAFVRRVLMLFVAVVLLLEEWSSGRPDADRHCTVSPRVPVALSQSGRQPATRQTCRGCLYSLVDMGLSWLAAVSPRRPHARYVFRVRG